MAAPPHKVTETDAFFAAGAALAALDPWLRSPPPFAGVWRARLALQAAAATLKRLGRREGEGELRDAWALSKPGQDPGPAGRVYAAWRRLSDPGDAFRPERLRAVAEDLQRPLEAAQANVLADAIRDSGISAGRGPPAAAAAAAAVRAVSPDAEALAFWAADAALALSLRWPLALPLLATEWAKPIYAGRNGRVSLPGEAGGAKICALAYGAAAHDALAVAEDLSRSAGRMLAAAPQLRAKGKSGAIAALLNDDCRPAAATLPNLSERARRRLFDRLVGLGALRELTGRAAFRLYGL